MTEFANKVATVNYGSWPSPLSSQLLTQGIHRLSEPQLDNGHCYWLESRPEEKGRTVVMCQPATGSAYSVTPDDYSVRTRMHEYGGGAYRVHHNTLFFINDKDQRIYAMPTDGDDNGQISPKALTPVGQYRYADLWVDSERQQLICACEIHKDNQKEPENCIVAIKLDGSSTTAFNVLAFGNDFYSNPRVSPDGRYLSWLTWKHPNMPWDNSECWIAEVNSFGLLHKHRKVAGGSDDGSRSESIFQPQWSPTGELFFVSDRSDWWNLYRYSIEGKTVTPVLKKEAEFATPQWVFGMSTYGFLNSFTVFCCYTTAGQWQAGLIDTITQQFTPLTLAYTDIEAIACDDENDNAAFIGSTHTTLPEIATWQNGQITTIANSGSLAISADVFSQPEAITFTNSRQQPVHGFFYPAHSATTTGPEGEKPPLIVMCHGGPTGATRTALNLKIQYWTSRGFAVFDINYSGSTGYGRAYRDRLKQQWGVFDVEDICQGANYLAEAGKVDSNKMIVRGSSAGGYTVLAALTFNDTFKAGASLYGIGDLSLLAADTHKFEARYLDQLVGPYPEEKAIYDARSPLHHVDQLHCPVIFLQGLEDKVVPPNQAQAMVTALASKNIPTAYITFAEEGHGFRQAENIQRALDSEYQFYAKLFSLQPAETLPDIDFVTADIQSSTEVER